MTRPLYSSRAKFVWACKKVKALKLEVLRYRDRKPQRVITEYDPTLTKYTFRLQVLEEMPAISWGLQIGDCLQAFRSSLDHAIFEIASRHEGVWPRPSKDEHVLQFPICDEGRFEKNIWRLGQMGKEPEVRTCIEGLQPYNRPSAIPLTLLRDLNDRDKHRVITVVLARTRELKWSIDNATGRRIQPILEIGLGPLEHGAKILAIRFNPPEPDVKMKGTPEFTFYPAIAYPATQEAKLHKASDLIELGGMFGVIRDEVKYCLLSLSKLVT